MATKKYKNMLFINSCIYIYIAVNSSFLVTGPRDFLSDPSVYLTRDERSGKGQVVTVKFC